MERKRLLELALETLEIRRTEIEREIAELREFQDGPKRVSVRTPKKTTILAVKSRSRTAAAERKAQSERMKKIWAARRLASKAAVAAKTVAAVAKRKPKSAAQKKALSLKMKQVWAKKKAAAKKA